MSAERSTPIGLHAVDLGEQSGTCGYLPDRVATHAMWLAWRVAPDVYHGLMDRGYRRSGRILYRPVCAGCARCVPIRIPAESFRPSASQKRVLRRNSDVTATVVHPPQITEQKHALYERYMAARHSGSPQGTDFDSFCDFLYSTCVETIEVEYCDAGGNLIGVSICDRSDRSLSSVYHYFDPVHAARSLGTLSVLREIELCREWKVPHYYLGYWVAGCRTMHYKIHYNPHELLIDGEWRPGNAPSPSAATQPADTTIPVNPFPGSGG